MIESLRNHLAAHDKRVAFLFGAGTSSSINKAPAPSAGTKRAYDPFIPGIVGLTQKCCDAVSAMGKAQGGAWDTLVAQCGKDGQVNVESILSKLRMKIDAIGDSETLLGLDSAKLQEVEKVICGTIGKIACVAETDIPTHTPHDDLCSWVRKINRTAPLELFTTNYDILFERSFETSRVPIFDGFVGAYRPFFYPECLDDDALLPHVKWIRLWKLHGSVTWHRDSGATGRRVFRGDPSASGEMILPSHWKYTESRKQPFVAYMERLGAVLNSDHSLLITCGYSFGDEHINAILYEALENCNTANIVALQYADLLETDDLVKAAMRQSNFTVIGPNGGVISGVWGSWQLSEPVDNTTCSFLDSAFDSNALPEDSGSPAAIGNDLKGKVRLGDFNWFCRFLSEMGPDVQ
jgi:hypothetical protein